MLLQQFQLQHAKKASFMLVISNQDRPDRLNWQKYENV